MKILSAAIMACLLLSAAGCDAKEDLNKPKTKLRTMIIGGVPAFDHDYQRIKDTKVIVASNITIEH